MPPKKVKINEQLEDDKSPSLRLRVRIELAIPNPPLHPRIGHTSYVHPGTGIVYLVGGCDTAALPPPLKLSDVDPLPPSSPMPLVEQCDPATLFWLRKCSSPLLAEGAEGALVERSLESLEPADPLAMTGKPQSPVEPLTGQPKSSSRTGKDGSVKRPMPKSKNQAKDKKLKKNVKEEKEGAAETEVEKRQASPEVNDVAGVARAPKDLTWAKLAAISVRWKESEPANDLTSETKSETKTEEPAVINHPSVYIIGGWSGDTRVSSVLGVDFSTGLSLPLRCGNLFAIPPVTCASATIAFDRAHVFGGNTSFSGAAVMDVLDLRSGRWVDRPVAPLPGAPSPRSSHIAALLLGRYVIVHGGRRLQPPPAPHAAGKKLPKRVEPKTAAPPPILPTPIELCGDTAVFDAAEGQWVQVAIGAAGPAPRYAHAACALSECEVLLHGGIGAGGVVLSDMWIIRAQERAAGGLSLSWVHVEPGDNDGEALPARCHHSMAAAGRRVFLTGGTRDAGLVEGATDLFVLDVDPHSEAVVVQQENQRRTTMAKNVKRK